MNKCEVIQPLITRPVLDGSLIHTNAFTSTQDTSESKGSMNHEVSHIVGCKGVFGREGGYEA